MSTAPAPALRHVHDLVAAEQAGALPDGELLSRFASLREEPAFRALVARHGPLVLGVCRRVLGDFHAAEDAFQATFLILARKAATISRQSALAPWLYRVAYRTANRARYLNSSRKAHEAQKPAAPPRDALEEVSGRELLSILDAELQRMSEKHRAPLVLCCLEGRTRDEAAKLLGWSLSTLKRRLDAGRALLRARLAGRGLALSGPLLMSGLAEGAAVPPTLAAGVARAAVAAAARGGLAHSLFRGPVLAALLVLTGAAVGGSFLLWAADAELGRDPAPQAAAAPKAVTIPAQDEKKPDPKKSETMTVAGRALAADGKPLAGAAMAVVALPKDWNANMGEDKIRLAVLHDGKTDAEGRFRVTVSRPAADLLYPPTVVVRAPGHALGFFPLVHDADSRPAELKLPPEHVLRGRLIDLQGGPAAGLKVEIVAVIDVSSGKPVGMLRPDRPIQVWVPSVITDEAGRFEIRVAGPKQEVAVAVSDERFQAGWLKLWPTAEDRRKEVTHALVPAELVSGRVSYADTGKPAVGAGVVCEGISATTDKDGRYRLNRPKAEHSIFVVARAAAGEPYVPMLRSLGKRGVQVHRTLDFVLPRGVPVRGKVVEDGSGKPVARAAVYYMPRRDKQATFADAPALGPVFAVRTAADGSFTLAVPDGRGTLLATAAAAEYVLVEVGTRVLDDDKPGGRRRYAHALRRVDFAKGAGPQTVELKMRPGKTVTLKLVGPKGEKVTAAQALSRLTLFADYAGFMEARAVGVSGDTLTLRGCDPERAYPVMVFDDTNRRGALVEVSGKDAGKTLTVQLQPYGSAKVRYLDTAGKPLEGVWPEVAVVLAPGPWEYDNKAHERGELAADTVHLANVHMKHFQMDNTKTDADGFVTLSPLVPGAAYRISSLQMGSVLRDFTVRPGETLDLKDVRLKQAQ